MESLYRHKKFLAGGSTISILGLRNWSVGQQVNPLASGLTYSPSPTHWPIGWTVGQHLILGGWVITDSFGADLLPVTDTLQRALVIEATPIYQDRVLLLSILSYGYAANNHAQIAPFFTLNSWITSLFFSRPLLSTATARNAINFS